jgi:hypothetical protein
VEILPAMTTIQRGTLPLVIIIHQTACHSYFTVPMKDHRVLRIASMDTLITLYFSLGLLDTSYFDMGSMECLANQLVELSIKTRKHAEQFRFPFISITCSGHQTSMSSLIRSKVERIMHKQKALRSVLRKATRRSTSTKRRKTVRPKRHRGH